MTRVSAYSGGELTVAMAFGLFIEITLFLLLAFARNTVQIHEKEEPQVKEVPIEVQPVIDDLPILKLGGKRVRAKLPDMWMKKPPIKRYKDVAAPSPMADKTLDKPFDPDKPLARPDETPPPPDAAVAKNVDEKIPENNEQVPEQNVEEEGAADGVKEGTEKDPLKAMVVSQYRMKIISWFNARFKRPTGEIPCDQLKKLRSSIAASVGGDRSVTGYSISRPSGNEIFDARVRATMDAIVSGHQELPPPPPNYPDILGTTISASFSVPSCE